EEPGDLRTGQVVDHDFHPVSVAAAGPPSQAGRRPRRRSARAGRRSRPDLGERFWAWRARQQPRTRDDIPRLDRPPGWLPEVDAGLAGRRHEELGAFEAELARIDPDEVPDLVDHRLLSSAMARVRWESDI